MMFSFWVVLIFLEGLLSRWIFRLLFVRYCFRLRLWLMLNWISRCVLMVLWWGD